MRTRFVCLLAIIALAGTTGIATAATYTGHHVVGNSLVGSNPFDHTGEQMGYTGGTAELIEGIEAYWGMPFTLVGTSSAGEALAPNFDIRFQDAAGKTLVLFNGPGDETGRVPEGAVNAWVLFNQGVDGSFVLEIDECELGCA